MQCLLYKIRSAHFAFIKRIMTSVQFVGVLTSVLAQTGVLGGLSTLAICKSRFKFLFAAYVLGIVLDDRPHHSGAPSAWFRKSFLWRWYAAFFSAELIKTTDLSNGPYLFGVHPHGILALSAPAMFGSEATGFNEIFPNVDIRVAVVNAAFKIPIAREFALSSGCISADKSSITHALRDGKSVAVYVGGADEALLAGHPNGVGVIIKDRLGFIRVAVELGVAIVPCFTFGEHETYSQVFQPFVRTCQVRLMKLFGFSLPVFKPNYFVPLLPKKVKLVTVVGAPIKVVKMDRADVNFDEMVRRAHEEYMESLISLHKGFSEEYGSETEQKLSLVSSNNSRDLLKCKL